MKKVAALEAAAADLPPGLDSPDGRIVCNRAQAVCFDRYGPSIGLTEAFLGREAGRRLTALLRERPRAEMATFSPIDGVECMREAGPCRLNGAVHEALTRTLYGEWPRLLNVDWTWLGTRYGDAREARPANASQYRLRLGSDGLARILADCNRAGGRFAVHGAALTIEISHSTMAVCGASSLEKAFRRDLAAAIGYSVQDERLYIELESGSGTMVFARAANP